MTRFMIQLTEPGHFAKWAAADDALRQRVRDDFAAFDRAVGERGSIVSGEALSDTKTARTLGPGPDRTLTEGPFAETVEQLGGFYVIDVADLDTAVELARLLPSEYTLEVRECLDVE
ncbi:YciI family protein [Nocardioides sp. GXZ039]|uniref:YciI family protein n=1 Tax=Nocardioides sp. GXZ039 TaxID=3136018 RepID=UPI0030F4726B